MKTIVISGINLFEGGPLSVYKDCLDTIIERKLHKKYKIIAFVHRVDLFKEYIDKIQMIELPRSRKNYLYRLWYEYIYFYFFSNRKNIDVWLSLHDITPNVKAAKKYVYCHNPSPFMEVDIENIRYSWRNFLFSLFYKYLYKINIKKNNSIIVQQNWIRDRFEKMYNVRNIIVAKPTISIPVMASMNKISNGDKHVHRFIYPAYPRFFKNFEAICEACILLEKQGFRDFEAVLTINGDENKYAAELKFKYGKVSSIKFIGLQERNKLFELYRDASAMIFPSKLETWGLPISEFKSTGKPILAADLPYAKETVGEYDKIAFFNPNNALDLAELMANEISGNAKYDHVMGYVVKEPYADNWSELISMLFE